MFHRSLSIDENSLFEGSSRRVENPTEIPSSIDAKDPQIKDIQSPTPTSNFDADLPRVESTLSDWSESNGRAEAVRSACKALRRACVRVRASSAKSMSATNVFSPTPEGKTLSGGLQPPCRRDRSVPGLRECLRDGSGRRNAACALLWVPPRFCAFSCVPTWSRPHRSRLHPLATALAADPASPRLVLALEYRGHGQSQYDRNHNNYTIRSHSPTSRQCWPRSRSLRPYLSARLLVAYLP